DMGEERTVAQGLRANMPFFLSFPRAGLAALVMFAALSAAGAVASGCGSSSTAPLGGPYGGTTTLTPPGPENTSTGPSSGGTSDQ
ncbi:MAG: hypothetical protein ACRENE_24240, partial [Polyangiaceae bacterium]